MSTPTPDQPALEPRRSALTVVKRLLVGRSQPTWRMEHSTLPKVLAQMGLRRAPGLPDIPTGAEAGCVTAEGAFDMMGNLHEWTADPAGTFRGGYYVDTVLNGNGCLYATTAHDVSYWDYSTGFRCCM